MQPLPWDGQWSRGGIRMNAPPAVSVYREGVYVKGKQARRTGAPHALQSDAQIQLWRARKTSVNSEPRCRARALFPFFSDAPHTIITWYTVRSLLGLTAPRPKEAAQQGPSHPHVPVIGLYSLGGIYMPAQFYFLLFCIFMYYTYITPPLLIRSIYTPPLWPYGFAPFFLPLSTASKPSRE